MGDYLPGGRLLESESLIKIDRGFSHYNHEVSLLWVGWFGRVGVLVEPVGRWPFAVYVQQCVQFVREFQQCEPFVRRIASATAA